MTVEVASVVCGGTGPGISEPWTRIDNTANLMTPCQAYQKALDETKADVLVMLHDDVTVDDPDWLPRLVGLFSNDNCVAVGFGGATLLGRADLYRKPFNIWNLARGGYAGNQDDWSIHGEHFTGDRRVAVLDQFCMAVRVEWLRRKGGWPVNRCTHHMLDAFLACEAVRDGKEIWQCAVACRHAGGASSTDARYVNALWLQGGSLESDHILPHVYIFNQYRDVLPIAV